MTEENNSSPIKIAMELNDKKINIGFLGSSSQPNIERLEDLVEKAKEIGKTIDIKKTPLEGKGSYLITFTIDPNKVGVNLVDILKDEIDRLEEMRKTYETAIKQIRLAGIPTDYDKYLGKWFYANPALKIRVGRDLGKLYEIFDTQLGVSVEDVYSDRKRSTNISFARAVISLILSQKYSREELSLSDIGRIMKKDHAAVIFAIRKFPNLKLEVEDCEDLNRAFEKCLSSYDKKDMLSFNLRADEMNDLQELYKIFERELYVSIDDVFSTKYKENILLARAVISAVLAQKWKLNIKTISKTIKKSQKSIRKYIQSFNGLKLSLNENMESVFKKCLSYTREGPKTDYNNYFGNWYYANPKLKMGVGKDLKKLYKIFERELKVSIDDVCSSRCSYNILFARAAISGILIQKYPELSIKAIAGIVNKDPKCVHKYLQNMNRLKLETEDYQNMESAFEKCLATYSGRKPYFGLQSRLVARDARQ